jgi:hypothetical protein
MCLFKKVIKVSKGSKNWVDVEVVGDVVCGIFMGGRIKRRKPNSVNSKSGKRI